MKNNRAQALVEFALILPVLIMIMLAIIDFGNIYVTKSELENSSSVAYEVLKSSSDNLTLKDDILNKIDKDGKENIKVSLEFKDKYLILKLSKKVKIITPGLDIIFGDRYEASVERVVKYVPQ